MEVDTILADRYQIRELLSQKAGRRTFLARDLQSQASAIVKILRFDRDFHWDDLKLFEREAATLKNIDRPEIPKYLDYFEIQEADTRGFALVQSYIAAPSLETIIKQGRKFSETEVIELADRLLNILTYLHQQNPPVIHRDIKPSNILLANRSAHSIGDVYLVDFGSVQTVASKDGGTITIVGSYGYIPLEQFGGKTTSASDLYSLGMTLIYLLTGIHPTELPQIDGRVKFTADISNRLKRWLEKMTHPHLDKRFDSASSARVALKSEDGSYGDFAHLKPANTQVRLYRDRDKLEIIWSDTDREQIALVNNLVAIPGKIFGVLLVTSLALSVVGLLLNNAIFNLLYTSIGLILGFCGFVVLPLAIVLSWIIKLLIRNVDYKLALDDRYIHKLKDRGRKSKPIMLSEHPRSQIEILAYNPGYTFNKCLDTNGKLVNGSKITIPPKFYLYCGDFEYRFPEQFSQAELWWLGKELSDFLNLELQVIYPTPKVPPEATCGGGC
jgi:hypothetical protein